jgi:protocatechuate 3,4-dioxygenase, beta subunit
VAGGVRGPVIPSVPVKAHERTVERRDSAVDPPYGHPDYRSTVLRAPLGPPLRIPYGPLELAGPSSPSLLCVGLREPAADLTRQHDGDPLGERIIVHGRIHDSTGHALPKVLVEVWQANAAGRYAHERDQHAAPLDPHFTGVGHCVTDRLGRFRFVTVKPGAYPWKNHPNAWRPAHVHFSVLGHAFGQRLVTQMYFPGDPLLEHDPIFMSVPNPRARERLIAKLDLSETMPEWALAYRFDLVLSGRTAAAGARTGRGAAPLDADGGAT